MNTLPSPHGIDRSGQSGFTLVELMIAVLIGLFLVGGLLTLTSAMKRTSGVQTDLGQLHDTQRLSLSLMADVIQSSGYFLYPTPPGTTTIASTFPSGTIAGTTWVAAQTISGTDVGTGSTQTDTVSVRYTSFGGDGVLNCIGGVAGAATNWVAKFRVDGSDNLVCDLSTNGAAAVTTILVGGVRYMQILYGVQTNAASGTFSVDSYLTATQVAAGTYWPSVISVQVTLWFVNPLYCATACQAGQQTTQPQTISMSRTIALMSKAGVNTI